MWNFHYAKIVASVWPTLAKETVLSKIINMVDVFKISLSGWFDDNNKKYIDTIMKLDNSKTIMLETKWNDIRVKNVMDLSLREKSTVALDYSEYAQEHDKKIFVDAPFLTSLPVGQLIKFQQSNIILKIKSKKDQDVSCEVVKWGKLLQFDKVLFDKYDFGVQSISDKDKKDIEWWLEYWIHVISCSLVYSKKEILDMKAFLSSRNAEKMKVFAKIETKESLDNFDEILDTADWIILCVDTLSELLMKKKTSTESLIKKAKSVWKPIIMTFSLVFTKSKCKLINEEQIQSFSAFWVDAYMLETILQEDDALDIITDLSDTIDKYELKFKSPDIKPFYKDDDYMIRDYILFNAYRIVDEVGVKAIVSYTENGYATARLSSLNPKVPLIAFTKSDETYRYLNMLRGVKWYKISQTFNYENLKRVWKEMIRIIFKWNISLDDKIIIVQANEIVKNEKTWMINWLELYKFKNI